MDVHKNTTYAALRNQEEFKQFSNPEEPERRSPSRSSKTYRRLIPFLSLGVIAIFISFTIYQRVLAKAIVDQCGTTPAEARARDCVFEVTGFSWLPKECHDPTVETEFLNIKDLRFYRDANYSEVVSLEEVRLGEGPGFFVTQDYHVTHCAFLFKKLHRAVNHGHKIDGLISALHHTSHCVEMLLSPPGFRWDAKQIAYTKYPYCGRDGGYNVEFSKLGQWTG